MAPEVASGEGLGGDGRPGPLAAADDGARNGGDRIEREPGKVPPTAVAMGGRVEVGARVRCELDGCDRELDARCIVLVGLFEGHVRADPGGGDARVRDHAVGDGVAEVDSSHGGGLPRVDLSLWSIK